MALVWVSRALTVLRRDVAAAGSRPGLHAELVQETWLGEDVQLKRNQVHAGGLDCCQIAKPHVGHEREPIGA